MKCKEWLKTKFVRDNCILCDDIRAEARRLGYSKMELKQARKELGIKTYHQYEDHGEVSNWFWYIER